jgi:hypothetical protein
LRTLLDWRSHTLFLLGRAFFLARKNFLFTRTSRLGIRRVKVEKIRCPLLNPNSIEEPGNFFAA